ALTASPGTDKTAILEICKNLFIESVESRPKDDPEVRQYIQKVDIERIEVPLPLEFEVILKAINKLGEREVAFLRTKNITDKKFSYLYKGELLKIKGQLSQNFRANYLEIMACNRLVYILLLRETLESQGIPSTFALIQTWKERNSKSIRGLFNLEEFQNMVDSIAILNEQGVIHPKLLYLLDILDKVDLINSRVLLFCNLRATCYAISEALTKRGIEAKAFVGQGKGRKGGLSQKKQIALLDAFRRDEFPVLVSTSVLEEGLDVDECNLVIFYDGTASAIRKIQRAGRTGRKQKGRVVVLTTHHTADTTLHYISNAKERRMNLLLSDVTWLKVELEKEPESDKRAFAPIIEDSKPSDEENVDEENNVGAPELSEKLASFKVALNDLDKWQKSGVEEKQVEKKDDVTQIAKKSKTVKEEPKPIKIIVDSREKNSKILFYLKKEGVELDFKQLDSGDYILSDRVAVEYKKGEDLLSSIIDGRLFEQLGSITNAYQIPILLIEGFPSGGIHPEAIAGALSSFIIDFGVSIIQTQSSEETAVILKRIAMREQITKKRPTLIRKAMRISNPKENSVQVLSSFPGINRTLASRMLESFGSIKGVLNATVEELTEIEGVGPKKSKKIIDLVNQEYK
ncbi:MAG: ERCC4 domain-containing protein, partial [Candidatus Heimdallarchaeota archaeon]